jgi:hypothetical protein
MMPCVPKFDLIGDSFTDWSLLAAPNSEWVGLNVYHAWKHGTRAEGKKCDFCLERHGCWFVSENKFRQVSRVDIRELVLNGSPDTPWAGWVTTTYKKHGSLRAPVNASHFGVWGFDESKPDCSDNAKVMDWWWQLRKFQDAGIGRRSMEQVDVPSGVLKKIDLRVWLEFVSWSRDKWQSALYRFLLYLLPSKEELGK